MTVSVLAYLIFVNIDFDDFISLFLLVPKILLCNRFSEVF